MTRIVAAITRALGGSYTEPPVHFHPGGAGEPAVCEDPRCDRPHLEV